ncbi:MAG: hypothetical protein HY865_01050 [Chloroflexi bacterium]|nr:hypothetical protein [Chloroflexota bacterium]
MKKIMQILVIICLFAPMSTVGAQTAPSVVDTTIPVDAIIKADINSWLETNAPGEYPYWAITAVMPEDEETGEIFVSLVALNLDDPNDKSWHITDDGIVLWMGSITIKDHAVQIYSDGGFEAAKTSGGAKTAIPAKFEDGGGSNVRFPWDSGMSMMYGTRGVHAAGGGGSYAEGFSAVDFIGGDDLGATVASNRVYAVANGQVDYYCVDSSSTLIRTEDTATNSYYIYAHLLDNNTLRTGYTFYQGDYMGSLKYGSFDDNCGWAEQTAKHYHLHFGFRPASGFFTMEGCTLSMSSEEWNCGNGKVVKTGQFIMNGWGGAPTVGDDANVYSNIVGFWDLFLTGAAGFWDQTVVNNMPDHTANSFLYALYNGVSVAVRIARVILYSNINLGHLVTVVIFGLGIKALFGIAEFIVFLFKAWKSLVPVLGA